MLDLLSETPLLETKEDLKKRGFVGEYLTQIPFELEKISSPNSDCFLFKGHEGEKTGPVCIMDTTCLELDGKVFTGMKTTYQKFLPENGRYFYIPTTEGIKNNPKFVKDVVDEGNIICFQGGEDPSDPFETPKQYLAKPEDEKNQPNPLRDAINDVMLKQALTHGHSQFFIGICRGMQLIMTKNLEDAPVGHRPDEQIIWEAKNNIKKTQMVRGDDREMAKEFNLGENPFVGCNHHLASATLPQGLRDAGWRVAYVSSDPNQRGAKTIEMAIRRDRNGIITGVMFENHPEKSDVATDETGAIDKQLHKTAEKIYKGIREAIKIHQEIYKY